MDNLFLLLFLVSIVALIVGLIKPELVIRWGNQEKKNRKSVLKVYGLAIIAFFILFSITTPSSNNEEVAEVEKEKEVEEEVEEKEVKEKEVKEKEVKEKEVKEKDEVEEEDEVNQEDLEQLFLITMKGNFDGLADVTYDDENKAFTLLPTDEALVEELIALVTGNQNMLEGWGDLVDGITSMSESLKDNLGSGYSIHLLNPANKDNVLLSMMDGIVFYNVADDL